MTTMTPPRSAYPPAVEDLLPAARTLADRLGSLPSRNRLKTELRIGSPKASALLDALSATHRPVHADPVADPGTPPTIASGDGVTASEATTPARVVVDPGTLIAPTVVTPAPTPRRPARSWPVLLLALPAFVAIWSGWVGLGGLTGFGVVHPLPGIADTLSLNTAITLPIGLETYAAYALRVWLSPGVPKRARPFAKWSAIGSLMLGAAGQVAYHLMTSMHVTNAPWQITTLVSSLPVAVLGMGAALAHLLHTDPDTD
jgi:hypothetical protein